MKKCNEIGCYSDGTCRDGRCADHTNGARPVRGYSAGGNTPRSDVPHLGVEIECLSNDSQVYKILRAQGSRPCRDGSLNGSFGCEFKLCKPVDKALRLVPRFVEKLRSLGAQVDTSCGMHVHLDARGVTWERIEAFQVWLATWQGWWFGIMPPSRRESRFVKPLIGDNRRDHYTWANYTSYGTVEIRIHGGTLNRHKVAGWLAVCADLLDLLHSDRPFPVIGTVQQQALESGEVVMVMNPIPTDEQLRGIFTRSTALEYLLARQAAGGVLLETTHATLQGLNRESETATA